METKPLLCALALSLNRLVDNDLSTSPFDFSHLLRDLTKTTVGTEIPITTAFFTANILITSARATPISCF